MHQSVFAAKQPTEVSLFLMLLIQIAINALANILHFYNNSLILSPLSFLPYFNAALPTQYFGDFERENIPISFPFPGANSYNPFNRPDACVTVEEPINFPDIGETVNRPTGVQKCTPSKDTLGWVLFPWVADTNAAGNFPGCAAAGGATLLTKETSPAFVGDIAAPPAAACQNFVIKQQAATAGAVAAAPSTGR